MSEIIPGQTMWAGKESGTTTIKRWVAECDFVIGWNPGTSALIGCSFNGRTDPVIHKTAEAATKEAAKHADEAGHVGAREVQVKRVRQVVREEIVT